MDSVRLRWTVQILGLIFSVMISIAGFQNVAQGSYGNWTLNTSAYTKDELKTVLKEYRSQIVVLEGQIRAIQKEADWLVVKIGRIVDSERNAPAALNASVAAKKNRIAHLKKEKARLEKIITRYDLDHQGQAVKSDSQFSTVKPVSVKTLADTSLEIAGAPKTSDIVTAVKKAGLENWVDVLDGGDGCATLNNTLPILFSSGSATLAKSYTHFLKRLSHFLTPYDVKVYVSGFADSDPIRTAKYPSNFELGASRAATIVHEMVKYGLKPDIFKISTSGKYRFAAKVPSKNKPFQRRAQLTVVFNNSYNGHGPSWIYQHPGTAHNKN